MATKLGEFRNTVNDIMMKNKISNETAIINNVGETVITNDVSRDTDESAALNIEDNSSRTEFAVTKSMTWYKPQVSIKVRKPGPYYLDAADHIALNVDSDFFGEWILYTEAISYVNWYEQ